MTANDPGGGGRRVGLRSPRFLAYLGAQFSGALNDNAFKATMLLYMFGVVPDATSQFRLSGLATALFPIPFLIFSPLAGWLADRYRKDRVLLLSKLPEVAAMALAAVAFSTGSFALLFGVLILTATQSAFFSPAKYGILPEVFGEQDLSQANGVLAMTTNLATLLGLGLAPLLYEFFRDDLALLGIAHTAIAVVGTAAIVFAPRGAIGRATSAIPLNPFPSIAEDYRALRSLPILRQTVVGLAYFTFLGALLLTVIPVYGINQLELSESAATGLLVFLAVGIAAGSLAAGRLSGGKIELGLVPLGAIFTAFFAFDLSWLGRDNTAFRIAGFPLRPCLDLFGLGVAGGLFSVPLNALLQARTPPDRRGRIIAFSNIASFATVLLAAGLALPLAALPGFRADWILFALAGITFVGTAAVLYLLPDYLVRLLVWLSMNTLYRLRTSGRERIPAGGALLVANHVSWIDALVVTAASGRMVRFMMFRPYYEARALHWFFKRMHVIPVAGGDPPEKTEASLAMARREIAHGNTVCIFAEGTITRTGQLLPFRRGLERVAREADAPIVPVWLDGLWGSIFSFERGKVLFKRPRRFRHRLDVLFGNARPSTTPAATIRRDVQELSVDAAALRAATLRPVPLAWLSVVRRHWRLPFARDAESGTITYGRALVAALSLRDRVLDADPRRRRVAREAVAIWMPSGVRAAVANLAVLMSGRLPVNLPPSPSAAKRGCAELGITRVLTTTSADPRLLENLDVEVVFLDGALALPVGLGRRLGWRLAARWLPSSLSARWLFSGPRPEMEQTAAFVFTRGTTGEPKRVALTHLTLAANLRSLRQVFDVGPDDVVLGGLPLSHAFAFMGTLCLPALTGAEVAYAPDPEAVDAIESIARVRPPTIVFGTALLLARYVSDVSPEAFRAVRHIVCGGAHLPDVLAGEIEARFGVAPLEGYGCSECAPILSLNVPDAPVSATKAQVGSRPGTSGHPLPGISIRIVDPATREDLEPGEVGRLWVRPGGATEWTDTGDVAVMDADGFLSIVDRAERWVRLPEGHIALSHLEERLRAFIAPNHPPGADLSGALCAVRVADRTGRPEVRVAYQAAAIDPEAAVAWLRDSGLPLHWIPAVNSFVSVTELPVLETAHVDRSAVARMLAGRPGIEGADPDGS